MQGRKPEIYGPSAIINLNLFSEHYDKIPITLCQINIEFHHSGGYANLFLRQRFFHDLDMFVRHNRFALMRTENIRVTGTIFHRMFFVNFVDKVCVKKFLC